MTSAVASEVAASSQGAVASPRSARSQPGTVSSQCAPLVSLVVVDEASSHESDHPKFVPKCARCRWRSCGPRWQRIAAFRHPVSGVLASPIAEKPLEMAGAWGIGCVVCANYMSRGGGRQLGHARTSAFARFQVASLATLQGSEVRRHCGSELHRKAIAALAASQPPSGLQPASGSQPASDSQDEPDATGVSTTCQEHVPRPEKFVWAVSLCHAAGSFRDLLAVQRGS